MWYGEQQSPGSRLQYKLLRRIISKTSIYQKIEIFDTKEFGRVLLIDGLIMTNEKEEFTYHEMITHIPMFFHKQPINVLIIGGGDGGVVRECLKHHVSNVTVCEIDQEIINISKKYLSFGKFLNDKRVRIVIEDGKKFLQYCSEKFDIIIIDGTDPIGSGKVLFEKSFIKLAKTRLSIGGIFCTQCESPFGKYNKMIPMCASILEKTFSHSGIYGANIPMYPSGYWCFAIGSDDELVFQEKKYNRLYGRLHCKYYNSAIHMSSFVLPEFVRKWLKLSGK